MANDKDVTSYFSEVDLQAFALVTLTILLCKLSQSMLPVQIY